MHFPSLGDISAASGALGPLLAQAFFLLVFGYFAVRFMGKRGVLPDQEAAMDSLRTLVDALQLRVDLQDKEIVHLKEDLAKEREQARLLTLELARAQTALAQATQRFFESATAQNQMNYNSQQGNPRQGGA